MSTEHSKTTVVSMAIISSALATFLHEGLGHGVLAWWRGDIPTEITSNHLSALRADRWVDAGGTIVNLVVGYLALLAARQSRGSANARYFLWLFAALNLLPGAGYFFYSGIFGFGDWFAIIHGLPHEVALRVGLTVFGSALYALVVRQLAIGVRPFVAGSFSYNTVGRLPYLAAGIFSCVAGAFDTLGLKLFFVATVAAAFGGSSGLLWADSLMPPASPKEPLVIHKSPIWWFVAVIVGLLYIYFLGRGIQFAH